VAGGTFFATGEAFEVEPAISGAASNSESVD
jgi:hypothetical protein